MTGMFGQQQQELATRSMEDGEMDDAALRETNAEW
jgi:hypothetical protein